MYRYSLFSCIANSTFIDNDKGRERERKPALITFCVKRENERNSCFFSLLISLPSFISCWTNRIKQRYTYVTTFTIDVMNWFLLPHLLRLLRTHDQYHSSQWVFRTHPSLATFWIIPRSASGDRHITSEEDANTRILYPMFHGQQVQKCVCSYSGFSIVWIKLVSLFGKKVTVNTNEDSL